MMMQITGIVKLESIFSVSKKELERGKATISPIMPVLPIKMPDPI